MKVIGTTKRGANAPSNLIVEMSHTEWEALTGGHDLSRAKEALKDALERLEAFPIIPVESGEVEP